MTAGLLVAAGVPVAPARELADGERLTIPIGPTGIIIGTTASGHPLLVDVGNPTEMATVTIAGELASPITNSYSRAQEHQADVFGLEAIHGLVPNPQRTAAEAFQILGETNLSDPDPGPFITLWLYDHPPLADRLRFAAEYDPWGKGEPPRYVK